MVAMYSASTTDPPLPADVDFDAVVIGTGLTESILAAALAVNGARVLHVDSNDYYGDDWATVPCNDPLFQEGDARFGWKATKCDAAVAADESQVIDQLANIHVDLFPKPLMSAGPLIDILARCSLGHYLDFKALDSIQIAVGIDAPFETVPASRADIFKSRYLSMPEKRILMRFLTRCAGTDSEDCFDASQTTGTFGELMSNHRLSPKLQFLFIHAIAFISGDASSREGILAVQRYCKSLLRFKTETPFLVPNYGTGELSQAFCRLCAVYGGQYRLRSSLSSFVYRNEKFTIDFENEGTSFQVHSTFLFGQRRHLFYDQSLGRIKFSRFVGVTDRSLSEVGSRIMRIYPKGQFGNTNTVVVHQFEHSLQLCPVGRFLVHVDAAGDQDSVEQAISQLFFKVPGSPRLLWARSLHRTDTAGIREHPVNLGIIKPALDEDFDSSLVISEAKRLFELAYPEGSFLDKHNFPTN